MWAAIQLPAVPTDELSESVPPSHWKAALYILVVRWGRLHLVVKGDPFSVVPPSPICFVVELVYWCTSCKSVVVGFLSCESLDNMKKTENKCSIQTDPDTVRNFVGAGSIYHSKFEDPKEKWLDKHTSKRQAPLIAGGLVLWNKQLSECCSSPCSGFAMHKPLYVIVSNTNQTNYVTL